jgi:putative flippase GtrA
MEERRFVLRAQLVRFGIVGVVCAALYVGGTWLLQAVIPIYPAIAIAYAVTVTVHFLLQRYFVFGGDFKHGVRQQLFRYFGVGVIQLAITCCGTAAFTALGLDSFVSFALVTGAVSIFGFVTMRNGVFRHHGPRTRQFL